jgi:HD-GYP domain-containing protein (c-di-GMP phosphodiesterase class II)
MPDAFRLSEVIAALSHALDLTEGQPRGHAARTCLIGMRVGEAIGLPPRDSGALYYALLLKDAGCSSNAARMSSLFAADDREVKRAVKLVDWTRPTESLRYVAGAVAPGGSPLRRAGRLALAAAELSLDKGGIFETRCERGAQIVRMLDFPAAAATAVRSLDEHWNGKGKPDGLAGEEIPLLARIACLAQTVEVFHYDRGVEGAREMLRRRRGRWFDPALADVLLGLPDDDVLWERLRSGDDLADDLAPDDVILVADDERLDRITEAFAQVIDAKSPYTFNHSARVAELAVRTATALGHGPDALRALRRMALLHDIGKLGVSNRVLDKPRRLTDEEFAEVRLHPGYTGDILRRVPAFAALAADAAAHHERVDGRGYPLGLSGDAVTRNARILAVADVFEALTAERQYRGPLPEDEALAIMRRDVGTAFCPRAFAALEAALRGSSLAEAA